MNKKLRRSNNQMLAGVCAGLAEYFDIDVTLVRVAYALLSFFSAGFPGLIIYIILWIVMPLKTENNRW
jgi:phage shock protein C